MLINGERINVPFRREIVFPRVEGDIVFTAVAVSTIDEFESLCPEVEPKVEKDLKGNVVRVLVDDPQYMTALRERMNRKFDYQVVRSLENVQWETVDLKDPSSWKNWRTEAVAIGLSDVEVTTLANRVYDTLQPTRELIDEQKKSFLAKQDPKTV